MSGAAQVEAEPLTVTRPGFNLVGEAMGEGPPIVLVHGLTATRRYVTHGSKLLPRAGFRTHSYDARGHGESDPAPAAGGYSYGELAEDLGAVLDAATAGGRAVLAGHSMGAHTLTAFALANPDRVAGAVVIGPTFTGDDLSTESIAYWDGLADGLERGGVDGFIEVYDRGLDPAWRETILRITRDRLSRHRHPDAIVRALREVPRSRPFEGLNELEGLEIPVLVVASHDDADPGHPYAVAQAWAERLSGGRLVSEGKGESPLAWQGGKLSREIRAFSESAEVQARLSG
jgi:pimeloyl-ACP methyl ester carboxylesterase